MKILILSEFFDPEPTLKGLAFAKALTAEGHEVEVLTGFPNYPGGKIYPGYKMEFRRREVVDGITIHRVPLFPSHDRSARNRVLTYGSFALSASIIGPLVVRQPDVLYVYHPPLTISIPALALKLAYNCPAVPDIQDLWPDTLIATGMVQPGRLTSAIGWWASLVYRHMDRIVVLSPGFRDILVSRGVSPDKVRTIYNWTDESRQTAAQPNREFAREWGLEGRFNIMFAGSLGPAQALDTVLDAAKLCLDTSPNAQFVFVGHGFDKERLQARVRDEAIENVRFIPQQPMDAMGGVLPLADALLVHLKDDPLFTITIPSKIQAYLSSGVPLILAVRGDAADLGESAHAGLVIPPEDPQAMADAVAKLTAMTPEPRAALGKSGQDFYHRRLSMAVGVEQFINVFSQAIAERRRNSFYKRFGKRILDLLIVIPALIVLAPLFLVLICATRLTMGSPVFFRQKRAGKNGKIFNILKFRSMLSASSPDGTPLPDALRTPPFGAFLRQSSLDELPGLINVLLGEMSLVGPRPLLPEYLPRYTERHGRRHEVLPGITGMAQINGRQLALFSSRMEMDVWYVEHVSLWLDFKILALTLPKVLGSRGVVTGQDVQDVDDLGLSQPLTAKQS